MSEAVRRMFSEISGKYDLMNSVLSFGIHHIWRKRAVRFTGASEGMAVLDCAAGTGDLAIEFKKAVGRAGKVIATDFCEDMIDIARRKAERLNLGIEFDLADVMNLAYEDDIFDISSISFGIRNVDDPAIGISEMARVVKPGGKVVVLEFGRPSGIMKIFYGVYSKYIMPAIGKLIAGNKFAYTYLPETAAAFPCGDEFIELMAATGRFAECNYIKLNSGIAFIYVGTVK